MALDVLQGVTIRGICCAVPDQVIKSEEYYGKFGSDVVDKFVRSTGVSQRSVSVSSEDGKVITAADLCCAAAEELIKKWEIRRDEIDAIVFVTQYPDYIASPATACVLQHRLGLSEHCIAYDVNQGCAGYVYGLYIGASHLQSGCLKKVLVLVGDALHRIPSDDQSQAMLFGDAGSATLLERKEESIPLNFIIKTLGEGFRHLMVPAGGARHRNVDLQREKRCGEEHTGGSYYEAHMNGTEVFNFAIKEVPKLFREYYECNETNNDTYDLFVLHQANQFMLNYLAKKIGFSKTKMPLSLDRYGNTSSASIPLTLCDYFNEDKEVKGLKNQNVIISGFGVGLSLGITSFLIDGVQCLPIIRIKEGWDDGVL